MSAQIKAKVTSRLDYNGARPPSPLKALPSSTSPTPGPRPRAKVNSSATIGARKPISPPSTLPSVGKANGTSSRSQIARAPSPFKTAQARAPSPHRPPQLRAAISSSAQPQLRVKVGAGPRGIVTAPSTPLPELRQRALTGATGDNSNYARVRRGSVSSHVSASPSGLTSRSTAPSPPRLAVTSSDDSGSVVSGGIRVKSKISRITDHTPSQLPQSLPSSPSFPSRPARVPSVSNLSLSPPLANASCVRPPMVSPIGAAGAGYGRFATTRDAPIPKIAPIQTNSHRDDGVVNYSAHVPPSKVDPTTIPLPPYSPPVSTVSFSSRSSASRSSVSYDTHSSELSGSTAPNVHGRPNGVGHARTRSNIDGLGIQVSPLSISREPSRDVSPPSSSHGSDNDHDSHDDDVYEDPERKRRNEAKSNRKIADLEITNKSLMAINSSLEAQKHRQAKEIRDLRRRLRESILILPPRAYREAKSSLAEDGTLAEDEEEEEEEVEDEEEEAEQQAVVDGKNDESYLRVRTLLEALIESGKRALESKPQDFVGTGTGGTKVLSEEEVRKWRSDDTDTRSVVELDDKDDSSTVYLTADGARRSVTPSQIAIPDDEVNSENETEQSLDIDDTYDIRRTQLPPITVTPSTSP
ncbi:hypothetical protein BDY19DRAFT_988273 [Irpex rosettiformis]|uniref:Uncharacterized protein n=1 Tax=Irpex rosettiformis TaxID=378272 RepID=A0ACB8UJY9_9APHY|nr:hypothetical protein BDY19DRAFT_988273 [Irpex rosettiformis]